MRGRGVLASVCACSEKTLILEVGGDTGRAERVVAKSGLDAPVSAAPRAGSSGSRPFATSDEHGRSPGGWCGIDGPSIINRVV